MPALHQMGHHSENLLDDARLSNFAGAILSPVNYEPHQVAAQIASFKDRQSFESIFDPQLYVPQSDRGHLRSWGYFPKDVDTADLTSDGWWDDVCARLAAEVLRLKPDAVCSPALVPKIFDLDFIRRTVVAAERLEHHLAGGSRIYQTLVVGMADLAQPNRPLAVASVATQTGASSIYLVLVGDTEPRRELSEVEELKGAMQLIALLERAGLAVTVGFCSSDLLLWKAAGARSCATGKFFNLRRFTRGRFEEPTKGGGQVPYFLEESLCAFLRESDLVRIRSIGLLSGTSAANPFVAEILTAIDAGQPWLGLSWRQWMYWFADVERRLSAGALVVDDLLSDAEKSWLALENRRPKILMEEIANNGSWLRAWRRALAEYAV